MPRYTPLEGIKSKGLAMSVPSIVKLGGVGVASTFILDSKDSLTQVLAPFASCGSLSDAVHRILSLSDLEFAGWILYTALFLSAVAGLIFGTISLARESWVKRQEQRLVT